MPRIAAQTRIKRRKPETEDQFLRRIDRTAHRKVKDGGPTTAELVRAIDIKRRQRAALAEVLRMTGPDPEGRR